MTRHDDYPSNSGQGVGDGTVYSGGAIITVCMKNGQIRNFEPEYNLFIPKGAETIDLLVVEIDPSAPGMGPIPMKLTAYVSEKSCRHGSALVVTEKSFEQFRGLPLICATDRKN